MKTAFVYSDKYFAYDYGAEHPLKIERLRLTYELCKAYGLLDLPETEVLETEPAPEQEIMGFHTPRYLDVLERASRGEIRSDLAHGLGPGDNPVFPGLWEWSLLQTGASLQCARIVAEGRARIAFNPAGGLHHAGPARASGFCYLNDPVLAILHFVRRGKRVFYLDIDAHHGDGVQWAFYENPRVLTVSFHQDGRTLFPGTGSLAERGRGEGTGYAVNVPMLPGTDDEAFWKGFVALVPRLIEAFRPDVLVTQLGVDCLLNDPLAELSLTTNSLRRVVAYLAETGLPWVALGGGGYAPADVARAWTLAWAVMNGVDPPDPLPPPVRDSLRRAGASAETLRDPEYTSPVRDACLEHMSRCIGYLEEHVLPKIL